jgi:hypothetical protein
MPAAWFEIATSIIVASSHPHLGHRSGFDTSDSIGGGGTSVIARPTSSRRPFTYIRPRRMVPSAWTVQGQSDTCTSIGAK